MKARTLATAVTALCIASALVPAGAVSAPSWACWSQAAARYHVSPALLYAIAKVETGAHTNVVHRNANGSYDIGVMQINSQWLPALRAYGITARTLLTQPCVNVNVGAWILSATVGQYGLNWKGVGAYNASTGWKRARYATRVSHELSHLVAAARAGSGS